MAVHTGSVRQSREVYVDSTAVYVSIWAVYGCIQEVYGSLVQPTCL